MTTTNSDKPIQSISLYNSLWTLEEVVLDICQQLSAYLTPTPEIVWDYINFQEDRSPAVDFNGKPVPPVELNAIRTIMNTHVDFRVLIKQGTDQKC
jgi:hypothetical protein